MSYRTEVYPLRNDIPRYVNALLTQLPSQWTQVLAIEGRVPGTVPGYGRRTSQTVAAMDKTRVRAMLDAWNRNRGLTDRYLDYQAVKSRDRAYPVALGADAAVNQAFEAIRQNSPGGAVMFMSNALSQDPYVTRMRMTDHDSYDGAYSTLLNWDDFHCFGLRQYIDTFEAIGSGGGGGNSTIGIVYRASRRWIAHQEHNAIGVYGRWTVRN
jgi:hypothetical protein